LKNLLLLIIFTTITACNTSPKESVKKPDTQNIDWKKLEITIEKLIDTIPKVENKQCKKLLYKYNSYSDIVDGAVAEEYCLFAYDYPLEHTSDFFEVLTKEDKPLIKNWAMMAYSELQLVLDNMDNKQVIKANFIFDFNKAVYTLNPQKRTLATYYRNTLLNQLEKQ